MHSKTLSTFTLSEHFMIVALFSQYLFWRSSSMYSLNCSLRSADVCLCELNHLRHSLRWEDREQVGDEEVPVLLIGRGWSAGLYSAEGDTFAFVGASTASVDQGWVEAMHVEVLSINEETLSNSSVAIFIGRDVELDFISKKSALVLAEYASLVCEDGALVPVLLLLQLLCQLCQTRWRLLHHYY